MALQLKQIEKDRLSALLAGRGNRAGKLPLPASKRQIKITPEQVGHVKELLDNEMTYLEIEQKTELSQFLINGVSIGRYNWLVDQSKDK